MHAATSTSSSVAASDQRSNSTRSNIRVQQDMQLFSPKPPSIHQSPSREAEPTYTPVENEPVQSNGSIRPAIVSDGRFIKPYWSEELMNLVKGFENSDISKSLHHDMTIAIQTTYGGLDERQLQAIRLQNSERQGLALTRVDVQSITNTVTHLTGYLENRFNPSFTRSGANWWDQFKILSGRTFKNLYRNPDLLRTHYAISVIVAFVCGFLFWKVDNTLAGFQNRLGVMFFICALFGFGCLSSMQVFASERLIFMRERANRYYTPFTYFMSKVLSTN